jgi:hypothetical protein
MMNHLTVQQILEYVDGTILNGERTQVVAHLESCPRCRREVDLQRALAKSAREAPLTRPSRRLVDRIMEAVLPTTDSLLRKIVNNLGNLLAMIVVLSIFVYALSTPSVWKGEAAPSVISETFKTYTGFYDQVSRYLTTESAKLQSKGSTPASRDSEKIIAFTIISLLALAALDKFVIRRVMRTKL